MARFHTILEAVEHIIKYQSETAVTEETVVLAPLASNNKKMQRLSQLEEQYSTQRLGPVKGLFLGRGNFDPLAATNRGKPNKTGWRDAYFEKHRGQPRVRVKDCGSRFHTVLCSIIQIVDSLPEVERYVNAQARLPPRTETRVLAHPFQQEDTGSSEWNHWILLDNQDVLMLVLGFMPLQWQHAAACSCKTIQSAFQKYLSGFVGGQTTYLLVIGLATNEARHKIGPKEVGIEDASSMGGPLH